MPCGKDGAEPVRLWQASPAGCAGGVLRRPLQSVQYAGNQSVRPSASLGEKLHEGTDKEERKTRRQS